MDDQQPNHDVLEQGPGDPGRIGVWAASRPVRLTAMAVVLLAGTVWVLVGPGLTGSSGPTDPADERAATLGDSAAADDLDEPLVMPRRDENEGACESTNKGDASKAGRQTAKALRRLAGGGGGSDDVRWAPRVRVLADGPADARRLLEARAAQRPATWKRPPLVLRQLADAKISELRIDETLHVDCRGGPRDPADGFGKRWVSVQPRFSQDGCEDWWAVDLYLDRRDRVRTVHLHS